MHEMGLERVVLSVGCTPAAVSQGACSPDSGSSVKARWPPQEMQTLTFKAQKAHCMPSKESVDKLINVSSERVP